MTALSRREFLSSAILLPFASRASANNCILLVLTGGPSHLDTWDMKPDAPSEIRGPFRPIRTNVPGIEISEIFPRMAKHADKYMLVRSVYSDSDPVHENSLSLIDAATMGWRTLPGPIGFMGFCAAPHTSSNAPQSFAENCRRASRLIETGTSHVRVNMFDTVFHKATWDSHGTRPFSTMRDYKDSVAPVFDAAYSSLLEDLHNSGLLRTTLVIAIGEFGRTPRINPSGGRDHWTKCFTVLLAGGGIPGGQIYGSSDATGAEPKDNPVSVAQILATLPQLSDTALSGTESGVKLLRRSVTLFHFRPVHHIPERSHIIRPPILILQIIRVLPNVQPHHCGLAFHNRRILIRRR